MLLKHIQQSTAPHILTSVLDNVFNFTPLEKLQYPLQTRLGGSKRRSGRFVEEKNPLPLPGIEIWRGQPVTTLCYTNSFTQAAYEIQLTVKNVQNIFVWALH
jgi:hypothetical protein